MRKIYLIMFLIFNMGIVQGQQPVKKTISTKNVGKIKGRAKVMLEEYEQLLMVLSLDGLNPEEVDTLIKKRTSGSERIFESNTIIVEDDLDRNSSEYRFNSKSIEAYLKDFDLYYSKADTGTIKFENISISNVKQSAQQKYLWIDFDLVRWGVNKHTNMSYPIIRRRVEFKVDSLSRQQWAVHIIRVGYYKTPKKANDSSKDDLVVLDNENLDSTTLKRLERIEIEQALEEYKTKQEMVEQEAKRLIDEADQVLGQGDWKVARELYLKARKVAPSYEVRYILKQLRRVAEIENELLTLPLRLFQQEVLKGRNAERLRNYVEARGNFESALRVIPDVDSIKKKVDKLNLHIRMLASIDAKISKYDYLEALNECELAITHQKKEKVYNQVLISDLLVKKGIILLKEQRNKSSKEAFDEAITRDPNNPEAFRQRAFWYYQNGKISDALGDLDLILSFDATNTDILTQTARCYKAVKNLTKAIQFYDKAIGTVSNPNELNFEKALTYFQFGKYHETIALTTELLKAHYNIAQALYYRGLSYYEIKDYLKASSDIKEAKKLELSLEQNDNILQIANRFLSLAKNQELSNNWLSANELLNIAILFNERGENIWTEKGKVNIELKKYTLAVNDFSNAIEIKPQVADLYFKRGVAYYLNESFDESIEDFKTAFLYSNKLFEAYIYKGDAHIMLKQYSLAIETYTEVLKHPWTQNKLNYTALSIVYSSRANAYMSLEQYEKAENDFRESLRYNKNNAECYYLRGQSFLRQGKYQKAIDDFEIAESKEYDKGSCFFSKGEALLQQGSYSSAILEYSKALNREEWLEKRKEALRHRAFCYFKTKNYEYALKDYDKFFEYPNTTNVYVEHTEMAIAYLELNQSSKCFHLLESVVKEVPTFAEGLFTMGYYHLVTNSPEQATLYFNRVALQSITRKQLENSIVESLISKKIVRQFIEKLIKRS